MVSIDSFARTDALDDGVLEALAARFEARGKHPGFARMLDDYLAAMAIADDAAVLDLGCGTGLAARAIARRAGFRGLVAGVDLSAYLASAAERLAHAEGLAPGTRWRVADVRRLDFSDASFDAVVAHTLLSHVDDVAAVLERAATVVRPGGTIAIFDGDYASLTFDHADPLKARVFDAALVDALVTNPRVMRRLPRLLRAAGLELVASFSYVLSEVGTAVFWAPAIEVYRRLIAASGAMTAGDADAWAAALRDDSVAGVFFGSCNYYAYVARRPATDLAASSDLASSS